MIGDIMWKAADGGHTNSIVQQKSLEVLIRKKKVSAVVLDIWCAYLMSLYKKKKEKKKKKKG